MAISFFLVFLCFCADFGIQYVIDTEQTAAQVSSGTCIKKVGERCLHSDECIGCCTDGLCSNHRRPYYGCGKGIDWFGKPSCVDNIYELPDGMEDSNPMVRNKKGDGCSTSYDCSNGLFCIGHICSEGCAWDEDCGDDMFCSDEKKTCVMRKSKGENCGWKHLTYEVCARDLICSNGTCREPGREGEDCKYVYDCARNLICLGNKKCGKMRNKGKVCYSTDDDCTSDLFCIHGICEERKSQGENCSVMHDCPKSLHCINGTCQEGRDLGEQCQKDFDCLFGLVCSDGTCNFKTSGCPNATVIGNCKDLICWNRVCSVHRLQNESCKSTDECHGDLICWDDVCKKKRKEGETCKINGDCSDEDKGVSCINGICMSYSSKLDYQLKELNLQSFKMEGESCTVKAGIDECGELDLSCMDGICRRKMRKTQGDNCTHRDECSDDLICADGICTPKRYEDLSCSDINDCFADWTCINRTCVERGVEGERCDHFNDCSTFYACIDNACTPRRKFGETCATGNDCSGYRRKGEKFWYEDPWYVRN